MRKFSFLARFDHELYESGELSKKYWSVSPEDNSRVVLGENTRKLIEEQKQKGEYLSLKVTVSNHRSTFTENQRKTLFMVLKIMAKEMNALYNDKENVTAMNLYADYIYLFARKSTIVCDRDIAGFLAAEYRYNEIKPVDERQVKLTVWRSFSHMDIQEASEMIDYHLRKLAEMGVHIELSADAEQARRQFRQELNDKEIVLYDNLSLKEYAEKNQSCEACGKYVGKGGGSNAHIVARGMGGNQASWQDTPFNILRLCDPCHIDFDNGSGHIYFKKKYPWLKYKIERAYVREEQIKQEKQQ